MEKLTLWPAYSIKSTWMDKSFEQLKKNFNENIFQNKINIFKIKQLNIFEIYQIFFKIKLNIIK